jgi:hypothetical protein
MSKGHALAVLIAKCDLLAYGQIEALDLSCPVSDMVLMCFNPGRGSARLALLWHAQQEARARLMVAACLRGQGR